nr:LOW QUALITY PROTEIN: uncharacterized protein LOC119179385 [Rhipicephalus microplus]
MSAVFCLVILQNGSRRKLKLATGTYAEFLQKVTAIVDVDLENTLIQVYDTDLDDFVDLAPEDEILNKAKLRVISRSASVLCHAAVDTGDQDVAPPYPQSPILARIEDAPCSFLSCGQASDSDEMQVDDAPTKHTSVHESNDCLKFALPQSFGIYCDAFLKSKRPVTAQVKDAHDLSSVQGAPQCEIREHPTQRQYNKVLDLLVAKYPRVMEGKYSRRRWLIALRSRFRSERENLTGASAAAVKALETSGTNLLLPEANDKCTYARVPHVTTPSSSTNASSCKGKSAQEEHLSELMNTSADAVTAGDAAVASVSDLTGCVEMSEPFEDDEELIDCPDDSDASPENVTLSSLLEMCTNERASEALMTQLEDRATLDENESADESAEEARHSKMEQIKEAVGSVPQKSAHVSNSKERTGKVISKDRMELEKRTPEANVNELSRNTRRVAGAGAPRAVPPFAAHRGSLQGHSSSAESPEREKRPEGLPFPFENLPGYIRRALNDKKPIPRAERRALVRCVVEELTEACPRPTREFFQEAAMAIVKAFPDALADRRPDGKLRGKGYSSFCEQLKARANYLALRRRTISPATPWGHTSSTYSAEGFSFHLIYVPKFVQKALKARRPLPQRERRDLVRCVAEQLTTMSDRPQRNLIRQAAMDVVQAFPDALEDRNPDGGLLGTGYDSFFQQLESLIETLLVREKRTVVSIAQQLQQSCGRRATKDLYGCVNWQPATNSDPPEEVDERIQFLKREAKKGPKEIDARRCSDYMEEMYPEQRSFINADPPPSISAVKDQWPMLFHRPFFYNHGNKLLAKDVKAIFDQKVSTYAPPLVRYMETITRTDVIYILLAMEKGTKKGNANAEEEAMLPLLCSYFREDERHLYRVLEEGTDIAEILPELPSTPTIVALGGIFQKKCFVTCEQQILFTEPVDFSEATCLLLLSYYVFNLAYPDPVAATLEFLQRETFSINPSEAANARTNEGRGLP